MKKLLVLFVVLFLVCGIAFAADNSVRIKELQAQQQVIAQDIMKAQQFIKQKEAELLKMQGALEELAKQDETGKKKEDVKK